MKSFLIWGKYTGPEDLATFFLDDSVEYVGSLPKYVF